MSQQMILAPDKKVVEIKAPVDEQLFPQEISLPKVVIKGTGASKHAYRGLMTWWRELPAESQRPVALLTMSAITFLATSLSALVFARLLKKKE
jgi:hypothetical protein